MLQLVTLRPQVRVRAQRVCDMRRLYTVGDTEHGNGHKRLHRSQYDDQSRRRSRCEGSGMFCSCWRSCSALIFNQVYIFDIVEVVPDATAGFKRWYRLKLLCKDEAKGPVTALCGMDNYLVSSMGQKVRSYE